MASRRLRVGGSLLLGVAILPAPVVMAADYMGEETAQRVLFPEADAFTPLVISLGESGHRQVAALAGPQPPHGRLRAWVALRAGAPVGHVLVDEVQGRVDLITYATGIDLQGRLRTPEILSYRESHGGEVRAPRWRAQFDGHDSLESLRFGREIRNIAGATLSSEHVTQGMRWLLALWQVALRPGAGAAAGAGGGGTR